MVFDDTEYISLTTQQNDSFWEWLNTPPKPIQELNAMLRACPNDPTPGRNDPCPCGSGKKYKKCHGAG